MAPMTPWEFVEWVKVNIRDPVPMDSKERMHELLDVLSDDEVSISYKDFALKGIGMIAIKYSAKPIILCGALPLIRNQLNSPHEVLIAQSIRTLTFIADNGGEKEVYDDKVHMLVRTLVSRKDMPKHIKDMGLKLYFRMLDTPLEHGF